MSDAAPIELAGMFLEWQLIEDAKDELAERSKDLFKAAKDKGYDTKSMRAVFSEKRADLEASPEDVAKAEEAEAMNDLYRSALDRGLTARARPAHDAREIIEEFDAETGEIRDEPEAAAEVAGDYLREPVAAEQGQIIREGDAPRETDCQAGEASQGGSDASRLDTVSNSAASSRQSNTAGDDEILPVVASPHQNPAHSAPLNTQAVPATSERGADVAARSPSSFDLRVA